MATTLAPTREGMRDTGIPTQFKNEPSTDFTNPEIARRMKAAIERVRSEMGREYDLVIGGRHLKTAEKTNSLNPSKPSEIVGIHQAAGASEVEPAMQAALKAFETWKFASVEERTDLLFRVSALLRERKFELMAWMVFEVGKNWRRGRWRHRRTHRLLRLLRPGGAAAVQGRRRRCSCRASATTCATSRWASAR